MVIISFCTVTVECGQAEQVLATFGGHLVIMLCSSERRESVLDVLLEVIRAGNCTTKFY